MCSATGLTWPAMANITSCCDNLSLSLCTSSASLCDCYVQPTELLMGKWLLSVCTIWPRSQVTTTAGSFPGYHNTRLIPRLPQQQAHSQVTTTPGSFPGYHNTRLIPRLPQHRAHSQVTTTPGSFPGYHNTGLIPRLPQHQAQSQVTTTPGSFPGYHNTSLIPRLPQQWWCIE